jgi:hypothetical protein
VIEGNISLKDVTRPAVFSLSPNVRMPPTDSKSRHRVEQLHMDTKNESRGVREERVEETHTLQVDAPMTDKCHSAHGLGHERQMTPSSAIERPHGDAGRGEFDLGGCRGGDL